MIFVVIGEDLIADGYCLVAVRSYQHATHGGVREDKINQLGDARVRMASVGFTCEWGGV